MFTKNWYFGLAANATPSARPTSAGISELKNLDGAMPSNINYIYIWPTGLFYNTENTTMPNMKFMQTKTSSNSGVIIGTGTTAPTVNDYKLSGDMITNFTYSAAVTVEHSNDGLVLTGVYTITNTGSEPFTICEIGLMAGSANTATSASYKCLLERTVLDTPVTIAAGGVGQVTYTIRMNYPT